MAVEVAPPASTFAKWTVTWWWSYLTWCRGCLGSLPDMLLCICAFFPFPCVSFPTKESTGVPLPGGWPPVSSFYACSFPLVLAHWALPPALHPRYSEKCAEPCQLVCFRCCDEVAGCIMWCGVDHHGDRRWKEFPVSLWVVLPAICPVLSASPCSWSSSGTLAATVWWKALPGGSLVGIIFFAKAPRGCFVLGGVACGSSSSFAGEMAEILLCPWGWCWPASTYVDSCGVDGLCFRHLRRQKAGICL